MNTLPLFEKRHIGPNGSEQKDMLDFLKFDSLSDMVSKIIPQDIILKKDLDFDEPKTEENVLDELTAQSEKNLCATNLIGQGYYPTHTPSVILRHVFENAGWYTAYTPYQSEISQGRLEALLNYQTMVSELTGLPIANASLLDEATAAAEAMLMCYRHCRKKDKHFFVSKNCFPQTIDMIQSRAHSLGIDVRVGDIHEDLSPENIFGILLQYPDTQGHIDCFSSICQRVHESNGLVIMATDLMALTLLKSPGEYGADIALGSAQRFGIPLGFGGPHPAFLATTQELKRNIPGRLVGVSKTKNNEQGYRLTLQTREQHIRREKATSNICTSQALLAIMASFYACHHGPEGLKAIAHGIRDLTGRFKGALEKNNWNIINKEFFDTLVIKSSRSQDVIKKAQKMKINLRIIDDHHVGLSFDETCQEQILHQLCEIFELPIEDLNQEPTPLSLEHQRQSPFLTHKIFHLYHSETSMMRYMRRLMDKDLALDRTMIPLGSCTMKLNSASEMRSVSLKGFLQIHPYAPEDQIQGYLEMIKELENKLARVTGYDAISLQPNSGAQGEYAGLMCIRQYLNSKGQGHRNICLIPSSAHGTNPASAHLAGMRVIVVKCDQQGNIDLNDLREKALTHKDHLAALMITYPSTHGVFEENIRTICDLIHQYQGQVYVDGANLNAMIGLVSLADIGADVSHLNLHKTFCIPHGGGGPGIGPIGVKAHLTPFLPHHRHMPSSYDSKGSAVCAAPFGSACLLPISLSYLKLMGGKGLKKASQVAILNANYIAKRLDEFYPIVYKGKQGYVAHECIIDLRSFEDRAHIHAEDVAKRLMDYGFHAPTLSWPVNNTLMIEPTESESKQDLDHFCDAMISIRKEIEKIEKGEFSTTDNPLIHAPHTADMIAQEHWPHCYCRQEAVFPGKTNPQTKYWPPIGRIDNTFGDRHIMCSCPPFDNE